MHIFCHILHILLHIVSYFLPPPPRRLRVRAHGSRRRARQRARPPCTRVPEAGPAAAVEWHAPPAASGRATPTSATAHTSCGGRPCVGGGGFGGGPGGAWAEAEGVGRGLPHLRPRAWSEPHRFRQPCHTEEDGSREKEESEEKGAKPSQLLPPTFEHAVLDLSLHACAAGRAPARDYTR
jgi:hypothetical protein